MGMKCFDSIHENNERNKSIALDCLYQVRRNFILKSYSFVIGWYKAGTTAVHHQAAQEWGDHCWRFDPAYLIVFVAHRLFNGFTCSNLFADKYCFKHFDNDPFQLFHN